MMTKLMPLFNKRVLRPRLLSYLVHNPVPTSSSTTLELREEKSPQGDKFYVPKRPQMGMDLPPAGELLAEDETLRSADYFQVHNLFTVKDLMDSRVHLGHKMGSLHPKMADFVFGYRFDNCVIDLDKTAFHLRQALNFLAHVAYRKGIILFVTRSPQNIFLVESTAMECGEYAHCREWDMHTLTNSTRKYGGITRLPDTIILLNTLDTVMARHLGVTDAAKMLIPTVGVVDTNCDPSLISYPIPGNDDTPSAVHLYCKLFKEAILRGKNKRKQVETQKAQQQDDDNDSKKS